MVCRPVTLSSVQGQVPADAVGAVFPGTLERLFGLDYDFREIWGVSQVEFETFTLGTLGVLLILGVVGYVRGARVRRHAAAETAPMSIRRGAPRCVPRRPCAQGAMSRQVTGRARGPRPAPGTRRAA